jgi:hypothetical protein
MAENCRQHYNLATGGALQQADKAKKVLQLARGGKVSAYKQPTNSSGKAVGRADNPNTAKAMPAPKGRSMVTSRKGDDKFTSVTHKGAHIPKGFKVQRP